MFHNLSQDIHKGRYIQSSDPGAVGAGVEWLDTTSSPAVHKKRNATDDGWDTILDPGDYATSAELATAISDLIASAPGALDTLNELAAALGDDANFATTITNALALKAPLASPALTGTPTAPTPAVATDTTQVATTAFVHDAIAVQPEVIMVAVSDESTDLATGTAQLTFRMPFGMTLTGVRASVATAPTGATITVDVNESGTSVLSTKVTIDAGEKTSTTAATPPVISDSALADDAEITIDIDQVGSTVAGAGLKVSLIGTRA